LIAGITGGGVGVIRIICVIDGVTIGPGSIGQPVKSIIKIIKMIENKNLVFI